MPHGPTVSGDPAGLDRLRQRIRDIEGAGTSFGDGGRGIASTAFGVAEVDRHLPWGGLPRGALHEIVADDAGASTGFCAALIGRIARLECDVGTRSTGHRVGRDARPLLWCENYPVMEAGGLYAPGLGLFGVTPDRVILVRTRHDRDALWAMEEGLGCAGLGAVVGEARTLSLTASRRLQLAAARSGVTAFLLRPRDGGAAASAAMTRWRVDTAPPDDGIAEPGLGRPRWRAELFRCRGGAPGTWMLEWNDETGDFALVAPVRDRPAVPRPSRLAG